MVFAFDAFGTLFRLDALREDARELFGERGDALYDAFYARLQPWTWLATAAGAYRPLPTLAEQALRSAAADTVGRYKPAPEVYALAPQAFGVPPQEVVLVSGNDWDTAGAKLAGLSSVWISAVARAFRASIKGSASAALGKLPA